MVLGNLRNPTSQRALADMDKAFSSAHSSPMNQLMRSPVPEKSSTYVASAILTRGDGIRVADLERNVKRLQSQVNIVYWNTEGFKVSMCSRPPTSMPYSILSVSNNCCFRHTLSAMHGKFSKLYKVRGKLQCWLASISFPSPFLLLRRRFGMKVMCVRP